MIAGLMFGKVNRLDPEQVRQRDVGILECFGGPGRKDKALVTISEFGQLRRPALGQIGSPADGVDTPITGVLTSRGPLNVRQRAANRIL